MTLVNSRFEPNCLFFLDLVPKNHYNTMSPIKLSEVTDINKQKFLAELSKLLTFMYEEDRQTALDLYGRMFDEAGDENAVMRVLVSPTRQAVNVARSYDAKERKLQVHAQSRAEDGAADAAEETPAFVTAIKKLYITAPAGNTVSMEPEESEVPEVLENQVSLFEGAPGQADDNFTVEGIFDDFVRELAAEPVYDELDEPELEPEVEEPIAAPEEEPEAEELPEELAPEAFDSEPEGEEEQLSEKEPEGEVPEPELEETAEDAPEELEALPEEAQDAPVPEELAPEEDFVVTIADELEDENYEPESALYDTLEQNDRLSEALVRKPKVFLLILFTLIAAPITLIAVLLLLLPTVLALALSVVAIVGGVMLLVSAFSGFVVFADIIVVLGAALIALALGLLLLWLFIWFIGGAIVGLIRAVFSLGGKWCYKEVPAV